MELFVAALKKTKAIANYPGFAKMLKREIQPGSWDSDEKLADYVRREIVTTYHPTGTCKVTYRSLMYGVVNYNH